MAEKVQINLGALNRFINRTVQPYLRARAMEIAEEARKNAPVGSTGELRDSIIVTEGPRGSVKVSVEAPHAGFVHQGTGPQANPPQAPYFPKLRRRGLILWSEDKGLNPYAVAGAISQRGTPSNPFFEEAIVKVLNRFDFRFINRNIEL